MPVLFYSLPLFCAAPYKRKIFWDIHVYALTKRPLFSLMLLPLFKDTKTKHAQQEAEFKYLYRGKKSLLDAPNHERPKSEGLPSTASSTAGSPGNPLTLWAEEGSISSFIFMLFAFHFLNILKIKRNPQHSEIYVLNRLQIKRRAKSMKSSKSLGWKLESQQQFPPQLDTQPERCSLLLLIWHSAAVAS